MLARKLVLLGEQQVVVFPKFALLFGAMGGLCGFLRVWMDARDGEVAERQLHPTGILFQELAQNGKNLLAKGALEVRKLYDRNRRGLGTFQRGSLSAYVDNGRLEKHLD